MFVAAARIEHGTVKYFSTYATNPLETGRNGTVETSWLLKPHRNIISSMFWLQNVGRGLLSSDTLYSFMRLPTFWRSILASETSVTDYRTTWPCISGDNNVFNALFREVAVSSIILCCRHLENHVIILLFRRFFLTVFSRDGRMRPGASWQSHLFVPTADRIVLH
jgi:hypothetical protein